MWTIHDSPQPAAGGSQNGRCLDRRARVVSGPASAITWMGDVTSIAVGPTDAVLLDTSERARAAQFRDPAASRRYVAAHLLLRWLLADVLGTLAGKVRFRRADCPLCGGPHGRPELADEGTGVHFSLAHSGDLVAVAIADRAIGVDIERTAAPSTVRDVAVLLHNDERAELERLAGIAGDEAFTRLWARKEAYLKATGEGLGAGLDRDYIGTADAVVSPAGWCIRDVVGPSGAWAAVAVATAEDLLVENMPIPQGLQSRSDPGAGSRP